MSECTHDCSTCGENCADRDPKSFLKETNQYSKVHKVIGIVSGKGGVGKSMVTSSLASLITFNHYRTLYPGHTKQYILKFALLNTIFLAAQTLAAYFFFI